MRIEIARRPRRPVSVTPLIDVIFLLLLFFMLTSTFAKFSEVEITGGRAGEAVAGKPPDIIVRLSETDWRVNGRPLTEADALVEIGRLEQAGAETAVLLVRGAITSQAMVGAIEAIRRGTGLSLSVAR
ncbi:MAG: biopolymer transporter ExbD [Nitratireductor sp.]